MKWIVPVLGVFMVGIAYGQAELPTELEDCTGPEANFCFDGEPAILQEGCGVTFEGYVGRIAWPALKNVGPVVISVQSWNSFESQTFIPLYVEVVGRVLPQDGTDCRTGRGGHLVLVAQGADRCGGTWESVGPIDLAAYGVPLGANYSVQCVFFRTSPGVTVRTIGFSCISVTTVPTMTAGTNWGMVKSLYKKP